MSSKNLINRARLLRGLFPCVISTNSVFGLAGELHQKELLASLKSRPLEQPFSFLFRDLRQLQEYSVLTPPYRALKKAFTIECFISEKGSMYVRLAHSNLQRFLTRNGPILLTSANLHSEGVSMTAFRNFLEATLVLNLCPRARCSNRSSRIYTISSGVIYR